MGFEVRPDGTIRADTADEALELAERIRQRSSGSAVRPAPPRKTARPSATQPYDSDQRSRVMLQVLADAGQAGLESKALADRLGLGNPKGLAIVVRAARRTIKDKTGAKSEKAFLWRERNRERGTVWHVDGGRLKEAGLA